MVNRRHVSKTQNSDEVNIIDDNAENGLTLSSEGKNFFVNMYSDFF